MISVIIPVYKNDVGLRLCLNALKEQTFKDFEVIVINNDIKSLTQEILNDFPTYIFEQETYPSAYAARNKGITRAQGEILAFTDSDCLPEKNWLEYASKKIKDTPEIGFIGGRIEFLFLKSPLSLIERYENHFHLNQKYFIKKLNFSATANLIVRKETMLKVGLFKPTLKSGGDLEWGQRAFDLNIKSIYCDTIKVFHPSRLNLRAILAMEKRVIGGLSDMGRKNIQEAILELVKIFPKCWSFFKGNGFVFGGFSIIIISQIMKSYEWIRIALGGETRRA